MRRCDRRAPANPRAGCEPARYRNAEASVNNSGGSFADSGASFSRVDFGDRSAPPDPRFHRQPHKRKKRSFFEDLFD